MLGMPTIIDFKSVDENIDFAIRNGFQFIELNLNLPYVQNYILKGNRPSKKLKYTLHFFDEADFGLYNEVANGYILLLDKYLSYAHDYIDQVNFHLNIGPIVTVSGNKNYIYNLYFNDYIKRLMVNIKMIKYYCDKYKVGCVFENIESLPYILKTFDLLKDEYYFTYDIGHDVTSGNFLNKFFYENMDRFKEMHFHDSTHEKCHLAFGSGFLDIHKIYDEVKERIEYIVIEVKSKEDLVYSIRYLKGLL